LKKEFDDLGTYLKELETHRPNRRVSKAGWERVGKKALPLNNTHATQPGPYRVPTTIPQIVKFEEARWAQLKGRINILFPTDFVSDKHKKICPWIPRTLEHYLRHCRDVKKAIAAYYSHKYKTSKGPLTLAPSPQSAFAGKLSGTSGKRFGEPDSFRNPLNLSPVLCRETIWTMSFRVPWQPVAPWPDPKELEWEGSSRIQTENGRYGRMLPIPRMPAGWSGYHLDYKECSRCPALPFDDVHPVPDYETIWHPPDDIEDEDVIERGLLGDLLKEIDELVF
jgi:hypothetical protein